MSASATIPDSVSPTVAKLKASLKGDLVMPGEDGYEWGIKRWAVAHIKPAQYIVYPKTNEDIAKALTFRKKLGLDLAICSGGHSWSGASSTTGLMIHLGKYMTHVRCDPEAKLLYVSGGALWGAVDEEAMKHGLATVGGAVSHTGVGGLALGGGYGWLTSKHGLVVDNTVEYTVVLASGEVVKANKTENTDLFWGLRGGGSNFGIVTEFVFKAYPQRETIFFTRLVFPIEALEKVTNTCIEWFHKITENESMLLCRMNLPPSWKPIIMLQYFFNGPAEEGRKSIKSIYDLGPVQEVAIDELPYPKLNTMQNELPPFRMYMKGISFPKEKLTYNLVSKAFALPQKTEDLGDHLKFTVLTFELFPKTKVTSVPTSAMAFPDRTDSVELLFALGDDNPEFDGQQRDEARGWARDFAVLAGTTETGYANYEADVSRGASGIFGENYRRLQQLKAKSDPENVFNHWLPISPAA